MTTIRVGNNGKKTFRFTYRIRIKHTDRQLNGRTTAVAHTFDAAVTDVLYHYCDSRLLDLKPTQADWIEVQLQDENGKTGNFEKQIGAHWGSMR